MTKKDLVNLAEAIASIPDPEQKRDMCIRIGRVCYASNPWFDIVKWRKACRMRNIVLP